MLGASLTLAAVAVAGPPAAASGRTAHFPGTPAPVSAWDCWVDAGERGGIRCIPDRDRPLPLPADYTDEDEAAEALLELVHDYLHKGDALRAGELVRDASHLLRRDDLWTVHLNAPPLESSWRESRPERLVKALLCRGVTGCGVRFFR
ncbi:MAG: hypothetical protein NDI88_00125 [Lysobacter sp.]|nr:hypothetical protein [Lysobacter sp.]